MHANFISNGCGNLSSHEAERKEARRIIFALKVANYLTTDCQSHLPFELFLSHGEVAVDFSC